MGQGSSLNIPAPVGGLRLFSMTFTGKLVRDSVCLHYCREDVISSIIGIINEFWPPGVQWDGPEPKVESGYRIKLNGSPFEISAVGGTSESIWVKNLMANFFLKMGRKGWQPLVSSDLRRMGDASTLFMVLKPEAAKSFQEADRVAVVGLHETSKLQLIGLDEETVDTLHVVLLGTWHKKVVVKNFTTEGKNNCAPVDFHEFVIDGSPWGLLTNELDAIRSRIILLRILETMEAMGWHLIINTNVRPTTDTLFFLPSPERVHVKPKNTVVTQRVHPPKLKGKSSMESSSAEAGSVRTKDWSARTKDSSARTKDWSARTKDWSARTKDWSARTKDSSARTKDSSERTKDSSERTKDTSAKTTSVSAMEAPMQSWSRKESPSEESGSFPEQSVQFATDTEPGIGSMWGMGLIAQDCLAIVGRPMPSGSDEANLNRLINHSYLNVRPNKDDHSRKAKIMSRPTDSFYGETFNSWRHKKKSRDPLHVSRVIVKDVKESDLVNRRRKDRKEMKDNVSYDDNDNSGLITKIETENVSDREGETENINEVRDSEFNSADFRDASELETRDIDFDHLRPKTKEELELDIVVAAVWGAVDEYWPKGIQKQNIMYEYYFLKLRGTPWWVDGKEACQSKLMMAKIFEALTSIGWIIKCCLDSSWKDNDRNSCYFEKCNAKDTKVVVICFNEIDKIRALNYDEDFYSSFDEALEKRMEVVAKRQFGIAYEWKLKGSPWKWGQWQNKALAIHLHHILHSIGFSVLVSADTSSKFVPTDAGASYAMDAHSWFFVPTPDLEFMRSGMHERDTAVNRNSLEALAAMAKGGKKECPSKAKSQAKNTEWEMM